MTKPYTMSQYASKDDLYADMRADIDALKAENAKLRAALLRIIETDWRFRQDAGVMDGPFAKLARDTLDELDMPKPAELKPSGENFYKGETS